MSSKSRSETAGIRLAALGLICWAAGTAAPMRAHATACCAGGGGQSICVLPTEQDFQFGLSTAFKLSAGEFDAYGNYTPIRDGNSWRSTTTTFGAAYRLSDYWQLGLSVPIVRNDQVISGTKKAATGLGDPVLEGRYALWDDLGFLPYRPGLTLYAGMKLPLGTSLYRSADPFETDVTSDGLIVMHAGASASKLYRPIKLQLDGGVFYPFARNVEAVRGAAVPEPYRVKPGNRIQTSESISYLLNTEWSAFVGLRQLWQLHSRTSADGTLDGSAARLFTGQAGMSYSQGASWTLLASYETASPFARYLVNQAKVQSVTLMASFGGI
ncbi:MAG: hypothetical protein NDJ89_17505 [Oligoflexia bacterium]|nr:hypothetical protein [Oligoflexia bacterium]